MKTKDMLNEWRASTSDKLETKASELSEELMKLRFRKKTGQLTQSHHLRRVRKELARAMTIANELATKAAAKA